MLSVFLSGEVVATIAGEKSVVNMKLYQSNESQQIQIWRNTTSTVWDLVVPEKTLMLGLVVSMVASQTWQLMATYLGWPVSGTHTIISGQLTLSIHPSHIYPFQLSWASR